MGGCLSKSGVRELPPSDASHSSRSADSKSTSGAKPPPTREPPRATQEPRRTSTEGQPLLNPAPVISVTPVTPPPTNRPTETVPSSVQPPATPKAAAPAAPAETMSNIETPKSSPLRNITNTNTTKPTSPSAATKATGNPTTFKRTPHGLIPKANTKIKCPNDKTTPNKSPNKSPLTRSNLNTHDKTVKSLEPLLSPEIVSVQRPPSVADKENFHLLPSPLKLNLSFAECKNSEYKGVPAFPTNRSSVSISMGRPPVSAPNLLDFSKLGDREKGAIDVKTGVSSYRSGKGKNILSVPAPKMAKTPAPSQAPSPTSGIPLVDDPALKPWETPREGPKEEVVQYSPRSLLKLHLNSPQLGGHLPDKNHPCAGASEGFETDRSSLAGPVQLQPYPRVACTPKFNIPQAVQAPLTNIERDNGKMYPQKHPFGTPTSNPEVAMCLELDNVSPYPATVPVVIPKLVLPTPDGSPLAPNTGFSTVDSGLDDSLSSASTFVDVKDLQIGIVGTVTEDEDNTCVVCLAKRRAVVLMPCKHVCACISCSKLLKECPMCRVGIVDKMKIFFS